ncbi:SRPBCC family protein [Azospirillum sp.]|uniref:SRPBCC family protein n=1 Tax=Azospirillum sp. TaxID=34012 RepID=UPI002631D279|nr:SRPBCC family protein [Azospirillum sp.]
MPLVTTNILLPDPAHRLWPLVRWDGRLCDWYPGVVALTVHGHDKGAQRRLLLTDGSRLTQRLDHVSQIDDAYSYTILDSPYPVADLLAQIRVHPTGDGNAVLTWTANFQATTLSESKTEQFVRDLYEVGIERLRRLLIH